LCHNQENLSSLKTGIVKMIDRLQEEVAPPHIVVAGSLNMDLVVRCKQMPMPGQTVSGHNFSTFAGGKGANQAVAAANCRARVSMIGRVGNDDFGQRLITGLDHHGIYTKSILVTEGVATGTAMIMVDQNGENAICVAPGANGKLVPADLDEHIELFDDADLLLLQMEVPLDTVRYAIQLARHRKIPIILNPAPAPAHMPADFYDADILIPNEHELAQLAGMATDDLHGVKAAAAHLIQRGVRAVVATLGHRGALAVATDMQSFHRRPYKISAVDSTGAGDAFCGAFAAHYAQHKTLQLATQFAAAAGALACTKFGAQSAMPRLQAINQLVQRTC
jgi:ribokinase